MNNFHKLLMVLRGWRLILITKTHLENPSCLYIYASMAYISLISSPNNTGNQAQAQMTKRPQI